MGARVSLSALLAGTALGGPSRVSLSTLLVAEALSGPIRVSGSYLLVAQSVKSAFTLNRLESTSDLAPLHGFGILGFTTKLSSAPTPEHNPYRPSIPESIVATAGSETYDYLKENQEIQREQHNLTQAGDTTFPYQLLLKPHDVAQYRLGSISRFFHETYGLIRARYVQFTNIAATANASVPVGLFKKKHGNLFAWQVTNQLDKSDADLVVGVIASLTLPIEGQFGWVIVDGPNLQSIPNTSTTIEIGEAFSWSETGKLNNSVPGRVFARRVDKLPTGSASLMAGYLWIYLESFSKGDIDAEILSQTAGLRSDVAALQELIDSLNEVASAASLTAIKKSITILGQKLGLETGARVGADKATNKRIDELDVVSIAILNNAISTLQDWVSAQIVILNNSISVTNALAQTALDAALAFDVTIITNLQEQISSILDQLSLLARRPRNKFPVVDGSVPPNLAYLDDGSLVYTEE